MDRNELRRLAEAMASARAALVGHVCTYEGGVGWCQSPLHDDMIEAIDAFRAAAPPEVVLGLLDEIERLRDEAKQALVIVGNIGRELGQTQHERDKLRAVAVRLKGYLENIMGNTQQDVVRWDCEAALADPEVEKL